MELTVSVPPGQLLHAEEVTSVVAEGLEGSFGILPRHIDYVSALVPGILTFRRASGPEELIAVDRGVLVKCGTRVLVSVRDAIPGDDIRTLRHAVEERFRTLGERERQARSALATLESRFIRRFIEQVGRGRR